MTGVTQGGCQNRWSSGTLTVVRPTFKVTLAHCVLNSEYTLYIERIAEDQKSIVCEEFLHKTFVYYSTCYIGFVKYNGELHQTTGT